MTEKRDSWFAKQFADDRRGFLRKLGILGGGLVAGGTLQALIDVARVRGDRDRLSVTRVAMGTFVTINTVDPSRQRAEQAIGHAFEEMTRLIRVLSRHESGSALAVLNREGRLAGAPPELLLLLAESKRIHRLSHGAFDVTVKPLVDLLKQKPDDASIRQLLPLVDSGALRLSDRAISFAKSGMGVTLDGIAKGFIVDRMVQVLARYGIRDCLVDAGGDIRAVGHRAPGKRWRIAVQDPSKKGKLPARLQIGTGAIATSGSYEIYYDNQRIFHHLVDPHNGHSPQHSVSATVRADTVLEADALATATFVLPTRQALGLIDAQPRTSALLIDQRGAQHHSTRWGA